MINIGKKRYNTIKSATEHLEYLMQEYIYVRNDELNNSSMEGDTRKYIDRTELTEGEYLRLPLEERKNYVKLLKCDKNLIIRENVKGNDAGEVIADFLTNNRSQNVPLPNNTTPAMYNNKERRFCQEMVISPHPNDNVSPKILKRFVTDFINRSKSLKDYQIISIIHTDHYYRNGYNKNVNAENLMQNVHAQLFMNCTSAQKIIDTDNGKKLTKVKTFQDGRYAALRGDDTLKDLQKLEYDLCIEYGLLNTIRHNPTYLELKDNILKLNLNDAEDRKKIATIGLVEGILFIKNKNVGESIEHYSAQMDWCATVVRKINTAKEKDIDIESNAVYENKNIKEIKLRDLKEIFKSADQSVIRDKVRIDIDECIKKVLSIDKLIEEMQKKGYTVYKKNNNLYFAIGKQFNKGNTRISLNGLDNIGNERINHYNYKEIKHVIKEKRVEVARANELNRNIEKEFSISNRG